MKRLLKNGAMLAVCLICLLSVAEGRTVRETLTYSDYSIIKCRRSIIDPEAEICEEIAVRCPGSESTTEPIEHGRSGECPNGDVLTRWGNALEVVGNR